MPKISYRVKLVKDNARFCESYENNKNQLAHLPTFLSLHYCHEWLVDIKFTAVILNITKQINGASLTSKNANSRAITFADTLKKHFCNNTLNKFIQVGFASSSHKN